MSILHMAKDKEELFMGLKTAVAKEAGKTWLISGGSITNLLEEEFMRPGQIFVADERYVSKNDKASNYRAIKSKTKAAVIGFETSLPIKKSAETYAKALPNKITLALLGVGPDGHVASIFPPESGTKISQSEDGKTEIWETEVFDIKERLSVSEQYLMENVEQIVFVCWGKKKKPVADKIQSLAKLNEKSLPVERLFRNHKGKVIFLYGDFEL